MTYLKQRSWVLIAICCVLLPACTKSSSDTPNAATLLGDYYIVSGERDGTPIDPNKLDAVITIRDKTITAYDKERNESFAATYTLETNKRPWRITMISTKAPETGVISKGLIEAGENTTKLIYALPNGQPPTDFTAGERQQMFVLVKADASQQDDVTAPAGT